MDGQVTAKEQHKIELIEELVCKLANNVGSALTRAREINRFFFGVPDDTKTPAEPEAPSLEGWFQQHIDEIKRINGEVVAIRDALERIHEVVNLKK